MRKVITITVDEFEWKDFKEDINTLLHHSEYKNKEIYDIEYECDDCSHEGLTEFENPENSEKIKATINRCFNFIERID